MTATSGRDPMRASGICVLTASDTSAGYLRQESERMW